MKRRLPGLAALVAGCLLAAACQRFEETGLLSQDIHPVAELQREAGYARAALAQRADARPRPVAQIRTVATAMAEPFADQRRRMIEDIKSRGIKDPRLLSAMEKVPRHLFVPAVHRAEAYSDKPLPLDSRRSIYQPYVVALMTSLLDLKSDSRVLEIGTGSGYHTAVLARLAREVYSIEINASVASAAEKRLAGLGYENVLIHVGDGYKGWPHLQTSTNPSLRFDAILLSAAPSEPPKPLLDQLKVGGRMVVPVGSSFQDLMVITKRKDGTFEKKTIAPVRLYRMEGQAQGGRR